MQQKLDKILVAFPDENIDRAGPGSVQRKRKPSQALWCFVTAGGDIVLMVVLLVLVVNFSPILAGRLGMAYDIFARWETRLTWECTVLFAWSIAVKVTQTQRFVMFSNRFKSPVSALFTLMLMFVLWLVLTYPIFTVKNSVPMQMLFCMLLVALPVFALWRFVLAEIINLAPFRQRAIIVGLNSAGETLVQEVGRAHYPGMTIIGYVGDSTDEAYSLPVLGHKGMLRRIVERDAIDLVIMALDYKDNQALFQEALEVARHGISVIPLAAAYENISGKIPVHSIGDQWYASLPTEQTVSLPYLLWRKLFDLSCGLCGSILLGLLLPFVATLILLDSPGPIFYSQERLGLDGKAFRIYKFRSMRTDAERKGSAQWAQKNDPRITRSGRFLRATHLDELPQVFNILRGDMSLIGPRPERELFASELETTIPFFRCRLAIKPGLTGWAQVKYSYANSDNDALVKLQYDLYYIKHQSFMLDVFVILKTIIEVLGRRGV